jgi:hypothetical protein
MVSNDEINRKLNAKSRKTSKDFWGFLSCDACDGYYQLQKGESPEDFSDKCECGGNLKFSQSVPTFPETVDESNKKRKWDDVYQERIEERRQERVKRNKQYKYKDKNTFEQLRGPVTGLIIAIVLFSLFGIFGLLLGLVMVWLLRDI